MVTLPNGITLFQALVGSAQGGNQDRSRQGACLWHRAFHGLGPCRLGCICLGVLHPVDSGANQVSEQSRTSPGLFWPLVFWRWLWRCVAMLGMRAIVNRAMWSA